MILEIGLSGAKRVGTQYDEEAILFRSCSDC